MVESDLPSPNLGALGFHLRREVLKSINYVELQAANRGGKYDAAEDLHAFLTDCASHVEQFIPE